MPKHTQITALPKMPYHPSEIRKFAHHNLRVVIDGKTRPNRNHRDAVTYYASIIETLPPAFQVILMATHHPTIMAMPNDINTLFPDKEMLESCDILGFFAYEESSPSVCWGGMFETRERPKNPQAPDTNFLHEQGHHIDYILAVRHAGHGTLAKGLPYISYCPEWRQAVQHQLGDTGMIASIRDRRLYPGVGSLAKYLSRLCYQGNDRDDHLARESFAELSSHYMALYHLHHGNGPKIDGKLTRAYPVLWPAYRNNMLPMAEKEALHLLNGIQQAKSQIMYYEQNIAKRLGQPPATPESFAAPLRHAELRGGLPTLQAIARDARVRYKETPLYPPTTQITSECAHEGKFTWVLPSKTR